MVLTAEPRLRALPALVATRLTAARAAVHPSRLRQDVERLDQPRSRRFAVAGMAQAQAYVLGELESAGWRVRRHPFTVPDTAVAGVNLLADRGTGTATAPLLVGAHLDTVPGSPGADDNASGIAGLLELARILPSLGNADNVRLAVFDEEETGLHGSRALARERDTRPEVVIVFECLGYRTDQTATQRLPPGAALLYPGQHRRLRRRGWRGDWTLLAYRSSSLRTTRMLGECLAHLGGRHSVMLARDPSDLSVLGPLLRRFVPLARHFARSDHHPFWDAGVPAIQVGDTSDFRNPHYHRDSDTPETLDYERIADIVAATAITAGSPGWEGQRVRRGTAIVRP